MPHIEAEDNIEAALSPSNQNNGTPFEEEAYNERKSFLAMRDKNPEMHAHLTLLLQRERENLIGKHDLDARLQVWVLDGILQHGFSMDSLKPIAMKYAKIGTVPSTYLLPELFKRSI